MFSAGAGVLGIAVVGCSSSDEPSRSPSYPPSSPGASPSSEALAGNWRRVNLSFVSAYLLIRGSEAAVVDLGTPGSGAAIGAGLQAAGSSWTAVRHVIVTHRHRDHAGSIAEVAPQATNASLYGGAADVGAIASPTALRPVNDGDEVFGLQIIGTPGHTAGHIAVFDPSVGVLVAGDALRTTSGLLGPDPQNSTDMAQATASVKKMAALDVKVILPGHGAPLTTGAAEALAKLAAS